MKCPNCGAEVNGKVCEYCGSRISKKVVCPECGSSRIRFDRQYEGTLRIPVGVCRDCGCTWDLREGISSEATIKILFFIFGFALCFPIPVTYLVWNAEKLSDKAKYIIIGITWAGYIGFFVLPWIAPFFWFWF